ncbi:hypothetical protein Q8W71_16825 [Methylobacterium sp. NEAU 140]|uniref:hypothetical protein n=1 Tax=Methylobacterium sp. NEAU 140 TaxID=3064945 RepID=UPI002734317F|nr:hypothetical protein [Methylobacterium sp. NEAU 140]MDP4024292.1 hypothetical protein [Methylobacterium sp. NEAU 140]
MSTPAPTDPSPSSQTLAAWGTVALVVATVLIGALAPARHAAPARSAAEDAACLEWSDGCTVCQRRAEGPACSLPGIACQPGAPRCLHRAGG